MQLEKHAIKVKKLLNALEVAASAKSAKQSSNQAYQAKKAAAQAIIDDIEADGWTVAQELKDKL